MTKQTNKPQPEKVEKETSEKEKVVSRRNFIKSTALAGAGAAAMLQTESSHAQQSDEMNIKIPEEIPRTLAEAAKARKFFASRAT